jgi:hypothetical protein
LWLPEKKMLKVIQLNVVAFTLCLGVQHAHDVALGPHVHTSLAQSMLSSVFHLHYALHQHLETFAGIDRCKHADKVMDGVQCGHDVLRCAILALQPAQAR